MGVMVGWKFVHRWGNLGVGYVDWLACRWLCLQSILCSRSRKAAMTCLLILTLLVVKEDPTLLTEET